MKSNFNIRFNGILKTAVIVTVFFFLNPFSSYAGKGKTNFTGTWTLNETKSTIGDRGFGPAKTLKILQEGNDLSIERTQKNRNGEDMTLSTKYTLDGKECDNSNVRRTSKSVLTWSEDGTVLTITTKSVYERDGQKMESKTIETWKLSDHGKTLTIDQTSTTPRGERKAVLVYEMK